MDNKIKTIILDAGHGGMINDEYQTSGKRSPIWKDGSQYFEGVGNRQIVKKIHDLLKHAQTNLEIINITRTQHDKPLGQRTDEINAICNSKKDVNSVLLVSIHSNGFSKESANGWEVWTTKGETESDKYATSLHDEMKLVFPNEKFRIDTKDGDVDKESNFWIIKHSKCPAILSENFFHTNERECKEILMDDTQQTMIAIAHVEMILKHVSCK